VGSTGRTSLHILLLLLLLFIPIHVVTNATLDIVHQYNTIFATHVQSFKANLLYTLLLILLPQCNVKLIWFNVKIIQLCNIKVVQPCNNIGPK
jgi:hypothetical protein